jgi:acyl-CoA synthetase (AMP-forming)/AMP-acid ligase II
MEAKVVDVATGKSLPPNEVGELWVRGPNIMQGFFCTNPPTLFFLSVWQCALFLGFDSDHEKEQHKGSPEILEMDRVWSDIPVARISCPILLLTSTYWTSL